VNSIYFLIFGTFVTGVGEGFAADFAATFEMPNLNMLIKIVKHAILLYMKDFVSIKVHDNHDRDKILNWHTSLEIRHFLRFNGVRNVLLIGIQTAEG
jgi:hypothetical protein